MILGADLTENVLKKFQRIQLLVYLLKCVITQPISFYIKRERIDSFSNSSIKVIVIVNA